VTSELVFVHGRSQQHKNASDLKQAWISSWSEGLSKGGLTLPISEEDIRFPYYGDTLDALVRGVPDDEIPDVIIRGAGQDRQEEQFAAEVLREAQEQAGITDDQLLAASGDPQLERGVQNWRMVRAIFRAIDERLPGGSGAALALATHDVYQYLRNPGIRDAIDDGVRNAISRERETIVVGHSLGSVVSYNLLRSEGEALGWRIPLYVTVGSPLAITAIKRALSPIAHPACAEEWFNARDRRDIVALYLLDTQHFGVKPAIDNDDDVKNGTSNRHGISGYLSDKDVARKIYDAVTY
jgi:hypothetical protein